jgi:hypothetical protein
MVAVPPFSSVRMMLEPEMLALRVPLSTVVRVAVPPPF